MNDSTQICIDLPKIQSKGLSAFHRKLQKMMGGKPAAKQSKNRLDESGQMLIQRYKTELYESQNSKCDNEFMDISSGDNRSSCEETFSKKKSLSFISTDREREEENHPRDNSINFRKRRLPKILTMKAPREQSLGKNNNILTLSNHTLLDRIELVTFYPRREHFET
jgi:hypothetical protein